MPEVLSVDSWSVAKLDLDPLNPRLPVQLRGASQDELLLHFVRYYDLDELAWSMAENGYWPEEPLLTTDTTDRSERRLVVEGNRRLAALKLLTDSQARAISGRPNYWDEVAALAVSEHDLSVVPTRNYLNRDALLEYLGFRHVSGLMPWKADAKARYIYSLIKEHGYDFDRAAKVIGSRPDTIRRNFLAWATIEQARSVGVDAEPAADHFGVYYRALQNPRTRSFLNLEGWIDGNEGLVEPLQELGPERLSELVGYVFGSKRVIKESRQLDELALVLDDPSSLEILRSERDLELALRARPVDRQGLVAELRLAYRHAATANAEAFRFIGDAELLRDASQLVDIAQRIEESLRRDES